MAHEEDREEMLARLERMKAMGEKEYDDMYETHSPSEATSCYSGAKECFYDAINLARRLGLDDEAETLYKRLEHIKAVFRSQFT